MKKLRERRKPDWDISNMMDKFSNLSIDIGLDLDILKEILNKKIYYHTRDSSTIFNTLLEVIDLIINNSYNLYPKLWRLLKKYHCYAKWNSIPYSTNSNGESYKVDPETSESLDESIQYEMLNDEITYLQTIGIISYVQYLNIKDKIISGEITPYNSIYYIDNIPYNCKAGVAMIDKTIRDPIRKECALLQDLLDLFDFDIIHNKGLIDRKIVCEQ